MPIYEYICEDCGKRYDKFVRSSTARVDLKCPQCGSKRGKKTFSAFSTGRSTSSSSAGGRASAPAPACGPIG